jgi:hypothetical protein
MKFKNIKSFEFFLIEKLSINKNVEILSDSIYELIINEDSGKFILNDIPSDLPISEILITLDPTLKEFGYLDLNKSKIVNDYWIFHLYLRTNFLDTIYHECNHIIQTVYSDKKKILNKLNYLKAYYNPSIKIIDGSTDFFEHIYLSSDSEINSMVAETYGLLKQIKIKYGVLNKSQFVHIVENSRAYYVSQQLKNYDINKSLKISKSEQDIFFNLYENNRLELNKINDKSSFLKTIHSIYKVLRDHFLPSDKDTTSNNKGRYYENWIRSQGEKLNFKLFKLVEHFRY